MKNFVFVFMVLTIFADISSAKKLRLINGLNGGLVTGVNGVNPLLVGGLNPPIVSGGAAVIGQPPLTQFLPAAALSPYVLQQPPVAAVPYAPPNIGPQMAYPFAPSNGGLPYYIGGPQNQPGIIPPQQQVAAGQGPPVNNQALPPGSLTRFKRSFLRRNTARPPVSITQMPAQLSPTVSGNPVG
ncbi:secretory calcium-binding phosphoprotein 9 [Megalobrama amblycephala]|uniref:secretory calcium-binding phosphoprotein 9 n=1 Tax=Megalobrama amblycephala TaxID=75352 RepID=UPI0020143C47|nr:secretory calcium-binding phosphoprotein 9 [Megalobrama amblycephala]